jgi:hypothetical protein
MSTQQASQWETSGFYGAPVTKSLCLIITGTHLAISNLSTAPNNLISLPLSFSKMLLGTIAFENMGEVLWSLPILYSFRSLERRMGSRKFASFCLLCTFFVLLTQVGLLHVFSFTKVASGPYSIIFSLFVIYFSMIPKLSPNSLSFMGVHFSDKTATYFMGLQLALNTWSHSLASAAAGVAFGLLYSAEVSPLHKIRIPSSISSLFRKTVLPWLESSSPWESGIKREQQRLQQQLRRQTAQGEVGTVGGSGGGNNLTALQMAQLAQRDPAAAAQLLQQAQLMANQRAQNMQQQRAAQEVPVVQPTDENIASIVSMGFTEEQARNALLQTQNNVEAAIGRILG